MKRVLLLTALLMPAIVGSSQDFKFYENFETIPNGCKVVSSNTGSWQWAISTTLATSGQRSDSCVVPMNDTVYLTSSAFSTLGFTWNTYSNKPNRRQDLLER